MVEISQLQRLSIFLGHPTYSLSVVLFSILIGSGIGSFFSEKFALSRQTIVRIFPLLLLLSLILLFGFSTPWIIEKFTPYSTPVRILVSALILLPVEAALSGGSACRTAYDREWVANAHTTTTSAALDRFSLERVVNVQVAL